MAGTVCRASSGAACDVEETCDGASVACPPDVPTAGCGVDDAGGTGLDAGVPRDAGTEPAADGSVEPPADGGATRDGAVVTLDGGAMESDAGRVDGGAVVPVAGGCRAATGGGETPLLALGVLGWILMLARRRSARRRAKGRGATW